MLEAAIIATACAAIPLVGAVAFCCFSEHGTSLLAMAKSAVQRRKRDRSFHPFLSADDDPLRVLLRATMGSLMPFIDLAFMMAFPIFLVTVSVVWFFTQPIGLYTSIHLFHFDVLQWLER